MRRFLLVCLWLCLSLPVPVWAAPTWTSVAGGVYSSGGIRANGTLWTWGYNNGGQLGDGTQINRPTPTQIGVDTDWAVLEFGFYHTVALKTNGTLWAWGSNGWGQVGNNSTTSRLTPVQIGTDTWTLVSAGQTHTFGIRSDGTLWAWGDNTYGQLGLGDTTRRLVPTQVGTDTNWVQVSAGGFHTLAVKSDGTAWACGRQRNESSGIDWGLVGDGTFVQRTAFVQIGAGGFWTHVSAGLSHSTGRQSDGSLWTWGYKVTGLGYASDVAVPVPTRIGTFANLLTHAGKNDNSHFIQSNGALWGWGERDFGQLGDGIIGASVATSPIQIGTETDWSQVARAYYHSLALKMDGSLWAWGRNDYGQLGLGTNTDVALPTPVVLSSRILTVKTSGGDYPSIQACVTAAVAGDTCEVSGGPYAEYVLTARSGTAGNPITIRASGAVTVKGFRISHAYVTVMGFTINGFTDAYRGSFEVLTGGDYCQILNNTIRDTAANVYGLYFYNSGGTSGNYCTVTRNTFSNILYHFLITHGNYHTFTSNTWEYANGQDYIRIFGRGHIFRRNIFYRATEGTGENHPDFLQTWGTHSSESQDHLFEENWIADFPVSQFSQLSSGDGNNDGTVYDNVKNLTFRRNVIYEFALNANANLGNVRWENNTFYRLSVSSGGQGIVYSTSLPRGYPRDGYVVNNVFQGGGDGTTSRGFYAPTGLAYSTEAIYLYTTNVIGETSASHPVATAIWNDLTPYNAVSNPGGRGYVDGNGYITTFASVPDLAGFTLDAEFDAYKASVYTRLREVETKHAVVLSTFYADYNYVSGAALSGYPGKRTTACTSASAIATYFCEDRALPFGGHGINGGDPRFQGAHTSGINGLLTQTSTTFTLSTLRLSKTGVFATYVRVPGDSVWLSSTVSGVYPAVSSTADTIVLGTPTSAGVEEDHTADIGVTIRRDGNVFLTVTNASYTLATKTVTKTGGFTTYTPQVGDTVTLAGRASAGLYPVTSAVDANSVQLGAVASGAGIPNTRTNVVMRPLSNPTIMFGADGLPFTLDDGLKPMYGTGSAYPLCGTGLGGVDIGAYSCHPLVVFSGEVIGAPPAAPTAPTNVRIRTP